MPDIGTVHQRILWELHRKEDPEDVDMAMIALIDAMAFYRGRRFWFSEKTALFAIKEGVQSYSSSGPAGLVLSGLNPESEGDSGLPASIPDDVITPRSVQVNINDTWSVPLDQKPIEWIRSSTYNEGDRGYPYFYSWYGEQFHVYPIPNGDYDVRFDYVSDVDRPRYSKDGSGWKFENKVWNATTEAYVWSVLADTYTNPWLDNASRMIRIRAKLDLYADFYDDDKNAKKMQVLLVSEESEVQRRSFNFQSNVEIQPVPI